MIGKSGNLFSPVTVRFVHGRRAADTSSRIAFWVNSSSHPPEIARKNAVNPPRERLFGSAGMLNEIQTQSGQTCAFWPA
jgi:hypothetical protein